MTQDSKELAYSVLLLEQQLESYQKLHWEELAALWETLTELKKRILRLESCGMGAEQISAVEPDQHYPSCSVVTVGYGPGEVDG